MITPFHLVCTVEEFLRAQLPAYDPSLHGFLRMMRRVSLHDQRATLQFSPANTPEFVAHATLSVYLVPQKEAASALTCVLDCPSAKHHKSFRLLLQKIDEAQPQLSTIVHFLQEAFAPLDYKSFVPATPVAAPAPMPIVAPPAPASARKVEATAPGEEEVTLPDNKKYIFEKEPPKGEAVRMRTHDGKYVPDGALPATLRIND